MCGSLSLLPFFEGSWIKKETKALAPNASQRNINIVVSRLRASLSLGPSRSGYKGRSAALPFFTGPKGGSIAAPHWPLGAWSDASDSNPVHPCYAPAHRPLLVYSTPVLCFLKRLVEFFPLRVYWRWVWVHFFPRHLEMVRVRPLLAGVAFSSLYLYLPDTNCLWHLSLYKITFIFILYFTHVYSYFNNVNYKYYIYFVLLTLCFNLYRFFLVFIEVFQCKICYFNKI